MFRKLANKVTVRAWWILACTLVVLVIAGVFGLKVFSHLDDQGFAAPSSESTRVFNAVRDDFSKGQVDLIVLVTSKDSEGYGDQVFKDRVQAVTAKLVSNTAVARTVDAYTTGNKSMVSKDKHSAYIAVGLAGNITEQVNEAVAIRAEFKAHPIAGVDTTMSGQALINNDISEQITKDLTLAETVSFTVLTILLLFVFRGVVAALLPIVLGGFSIIISFLLLYILTQFTTVSQYAINVIIALGLGLSIDYSLLIVARFREELAANKTPAVALSDTMHTAGHTVFFSGLTVIICLLSLAIFPLNMLRSMGLGGAVAVLAAMIGGLIILPAALAILGKRINALSFSRAKKKHAKTDTVWHRVSRPTMDRPIITVLLTLGVLVFAGLPLMGLKLVSVDQKVLPATSQTRQVLDTLHTDFEYQSSPIQILYKDADLQTAAGLSRLSKYTKELKQVSHVNSVESAVTIPGVNLPESQQKEIVLAAAKPAQLATYLDSVLTKDSTLITVYTDNKDPFSKQAGHTVMDIRNVKSPSGTVSFVGGETAQQVDQIDVVVKSLPAVAITIVVSICVLMFIMIGSVVIPIKAMLLNLLSLSVALGAVVWIFQDGNLAQLFHFNSDAGINVTQPVIVFAIAFGLSMDYSVFLYSRIREEHEEGFDTREAVTNGLYKTSGTITSAAILLFVVVAAFATSGIAIMQQIGVGLSLAVLVDAFLVRMILVPASMVLLGKWNWWAPKWLHDLREKLVGSSRH